ncbi:opsin Rh3-like isoform X2 [Condylostylus longicornis]|uniref:opsin Rh3-like isoform X2 n=1 Tax=Condylostylus longicornis TaxID=2530218 RepID=UPI00244DCE27|nr:opsin Rh3-like isoform X2 [Condylostylus longicornis]
MTFSSDINEVYDNVTLLHPEARQSSEIRLIGWNIPPDEIIHVPDHWLSYPEPPASMHFMLGLLYVFFTVFSLVGNGLVIWIFSGAKSLRTPSNYFVINLAICDFVMMLKTPVFIYNSFMRGYSLGHFGCQIYGIMGSMTGIGASMTNAFIAYDRYNVITSPLEGKLTKVKAIVMLTFLWIYCIPWTVMPLTEVWGRFVPEGYLTSCTFDYMTDNFDTRLFVGCIFFCSYVMPMTMIIYFYSQIVSHVFAHEKTLREQAKKMNVDSLRSNQGQNKETAEIRIAKAAITICFLFVASWTPYGVMSLIGAFGDKTLLTPGVTMIPACACKLVACIDPYVYAISHPRYRLELQKRLPWLAIDEKEESKETQSTNTTSENAAPTA